MLRTNSLLVAILLVGCSGSGTGPPEEIPLENPDIRISSMVISHPADKTVALTTVQNFGPGGGFYKVFFYVQDGEDEIIARVTPDAWLTTGFTFVGNWLVSEEVETLTKAEVYQRTETSTWELSQTYTPGP